MRQNIWTFPIGLLYAAVTVVVLYHQRLYINLIENLYYLLMNAYGWFYWRIGANLQDNGQLPIRRLPIRQWPALLALLAVTSVAFGWLFDTQTDADLAYWDSFTTVLSFLAMWLTARKYLENWWLWLVVDVLYVGLYLYKELEPYALLYGLYIVMAVIGYRAWTQSMQLQPSSA
ncbi:MAG: nicotinamide riboside transporter PnuC [Pseudomonadales bacterium]